VVTEPDSYEEAWRSLHRRRVMCLCLLLALVPLLLLNRAMRSAAYVPWFGWMWFGWFLAFLGATSWLDSFRCPRCQQWFARTWWRRKFLTGRCVHCGLLQGARPDAGR
jgi:hypothetical protein